MTNPHKRLAFCHFKSFFREIMSQLDIVRRPRRLRLNAHTRSLVQETTLSATDLIQPLFVRDGSGFNPEAITSMPAQYRYCLEDLLKECARLWTLGIRAVAIFPVIDASLKNDNGTEALNPTGLMPRVIRQLKAVIPEMRIIADIALDPYTTHGHDGLISADGSQVKNDSTVSVLCEMAVVLAEAGADWVAPSDMMDGRIGAIRKTLDAKGFENTLILAYSAKFASAYYGPFRDAVGSALAAGTRSLDKRTYQLNPANRREALIETALDESEGADILMIKPAGPYLDIIREVRESTLLPIAAYQVSGEYAQIHAAGQLGWLDVASTAIESLVGIKRAGADLILTYFAGQIAEQLKTGHWTKTTELDKLPEHENSSGL
jgi:porphobilinogen synthase